MLPKFSLDDAAEDVDQLATVPVEGRVAEVVAFDEAFGVLLDHPGAILIDRVDHLFHRDQQTSVGDQIVGDMSGQPDHESASWEPMRPFIPLRPRVVGE